ncbi:N-acyl homoserine lactonase family protein [Sphingomonas hankyongi]|uniref:N-acyl homoserine lactonase family protein n=1 Tax=Sphingomonas hankyongi TaxID=2908209 RepID=A0ABT0RZR7_9SPHN|nr:N-acyl homoserine lactonase family protein [Sphingomonas hankyongi]MCL6729082.1 N-acyl homoserine lactonase family protein [Sphingomonas hankyongi]
MRRIGAIVAAAIAVAGCNSHPADKPQDPPGNGASPAAAPLPITLTRLDCGHAEFKDMNGFFSDRPGVYPPGPGKVVDSCYLIRHGDQQMVWDTGFPAETKDKPMVQDGMTAAIDRTLADQLQQVGVKPEDVDVVGISHMHGDHVGQAAQFTNARLVIGKRDFQMLEGRPEDSLKGWRGGGKTVTLVSGDTDVFGDGSVTAIHLPGHTPDHLGLLVKLKSGPVLLSGDVYHSTIAREKKAVPSFNTSKEQSLQSMDKFEALAKQTGAKVIIQHEPNDVSKLPAFPQAAE